MNSNPRKTMISETGEETLRLIAGLSAPAGLEERVHQALRAAPHKGRVLAWPERFRTKTVRESNWMRTAAAAAIVFVVVGGGWGVYSHVEHGQAGKVIVMPARVPGGGGFSGAGAMRTPQTLPGPTVREHGTKGTREQETQPAKKPSGPKKSQSARPAVSRPAASQAAARPAVSQ